jgi:hypothetical protein
MADVGDDFEVTFREPVTISNLHLAAEFLNVTISPAFKDH